MLCLTRWQRRLLRHKKTPSDMEAKTLVDALRYALEEKNADTQDDTLGYIEAETFVEALANTVRKDGGGD